MTESTGIEGAFDAALDQVGRLARAGMTTADGRPALEQLRQLEFRLRTEREEAVKRGSVDRAWVQQTVRWVVEWTPESELTLIAALGRIARLASGSLP